MKLKLLFLTLIISTSIYSQQFYLYLKNPQENIIAASKAAILFYGKYNVHIRYITKPLVNKTENDHIIYVTLDPWDFYDDSNIYYEQDEDGNTYIGENSTLHQGTCWENEINVCNGAAELDKLLIHELGHYFKLDHTTYDSFMSPIYNISSYVSYDQKAHLLNIKKYF